MTTFGWGNSVSLPLYPIQCDLKWKHQSRIRVANPYFCHPGRIDLLEVEIFTEVQHQGWQTRSQGSPIAIETKFGWVLAGKINSPTHTIMSNLATVTTDEILES